MVISLSVVVRSFAERDEDGISWSKRHWFYPDWIGLQRAIALKPAEGGVRRRISG